MQYGRKESGATGIPKNGTVSVPAFSAALRAKDATQGARNTVPTVVLKAEFAQSYIAQPKISFLSFTVGASVAAMTPLHDFDFIDCNSQNPICLTNVAKRMECDRILSIAIRNWAENYFKKSLARIYFFIYNHSLLSRKRLRDVFVCMLHSVISGEFELQLLPGKHKIFGWDAAVRNGAHTQG
jgi:hypothetical protein